MNKQKKGAGIEWCSVWGRPGYTWNPVGGCLHDCQWTMPDGTIAECYAKTVAERVARAAYPQGFEHHYFNAARLAEPLKVKQPAGIFLDSMSDLMGHWTPTDQIEQVLDVCRRTPQHVYFLLTKNAPRLLRFDIPDNVWVGVSSPPDSIWGKPLSLSQKVAYLDRALDVLRTLAAQGVVTWMSFEPLTMPVSCSLSATPYALSWAVIGAASKGKQYIAPDEAKVKAAVAELDYQRVPVFFKGNMKCLPWAVQNWRQEFPAVLHGA